MGSKLSEGSKLYTPGGAGTGRTECWSRRWHVGSDGC